MGRCFCSGLIDFILNNKPLADFSEQFLKNCKKNAEIFYMTQS